MLQGLAKAKALKELQVLVKDKASLKGLALAKALKRQNELRSDLGMGKKQDEQKVYVDTLVFNQNQEILLVQRHANDDFMPNKWWIAGGKLEQGETLEQGAKRELREETGIKVSDVTFVEKAKLQNGGISHRFTGVVDNDTPIHLQKDELQAYRWVSVDELSKFDLLGKLSDLQNLVELAREIVGFDGWDRVVYTQDKLLKATSIGDKWVVSIKQDIDNEWATIKTKFSTEDLVKKYPQFANIEQISKDSWDGNDKTADIPQTAYQLADKATPTRRQKDNDAAVALMRQLQADGRKATSDEKAILSRYTGTGGNLVGEDGLKGSDYEYYTPHELAGGMWDLAKEYEVRKQTTQITAVFC